ncbi:MAG: carboxymuconolactone decarboxylase family protein [Stellaceae bacterium]
MNAYEVAPEAMAALRQVEAYLHHGLDENLIELVKIRALQINGCAYCLAMHGKKLRANGESEQRMQIFSTRKGGVR